MSLRHSSDPSRYLAPIFWHYIDHFHKVLLSCFGFPTFRFEHHWRDIVCRNAHLVHKNWYRIWFISNHKPWEILYIDDVLSINNHNFHNYVHLIYPDELEIKDTTESDRCASYLDILLNIDSDGRLTTTLYDKRDDFDFAIVNFPFLCSNVPLSPAYLFTY